MKLGSLQLTAKLHELTMQASLAAVVFGYVRDQLALGEGIPFGAVFAGLHIKEISFFWSREFWGAMRSKYPDLRRRLELMLLLVIGTLLGVSVGPSSAIVLKPRIDDWPAGGTQFFLGATPQQLFPLQVNSSDMFPYCLGDHGYDECPSGNWRDLGDTNAEHWTRFSIASNDYPEVISLSSESAVRHLYHTAKTGLYGDRFTLATTQHAGLANALVDISRLWVIAAEKVGRGRFTSQRDVSFTIDGPGAQQPITLVSCAPMRIKNSRLLVSYQFPRIDSLEAYEGNDEEFPTARDNFTLSDVSYLETLDEPRLDWTHLPDSIFGGNSIGAVISIPATESYSALIYMCTVDSRWASVAIQSKRSQMTTVTGAPDGWLSSGVFNRSWPRINISTEWAAGLSPPVGNSSTVFEKLTRTAELRKLPISLPSPVQFPASQLGILAIEKILAIIVTNGLARVGYKTYLKGNLKGFDRKSDVFCAEWCEQMIPHGLMTVKKFNQRFGQAFESPVIGAYSAGSAGKWKLQVTVNGYAYSTRGLTMKIAVGILLTYSVVAVAHVVWLLKTGISSGCWDTAPEITVLALNSARTDMLRNTCSGIETTEPFKRTVRVVVRRGRHLEMIFGPVTRWVSGEKASDNDDDDVVGKVSKNEFYD